MSGRKKIQDEFTHLAGTVSRPVDNITTTLTKNNPVSPEWFLAGWRNNPEDRNNYLPWLKYNPICWDWVIKIWFNNPDTRTQNLSKKMHES